MRYKLATMICLTLAYLIGIFMGSEVFPSVEYAKAEAKESAPQVRIDVIHPAMSVKEMDQLKLKAIKILAQSIGENEMPVIK